jgi:hypothetical protein
VNANKANIRNFAIVVSPIWAKSSKFWLRVDMESIAQRDP